MTTATTQPTGAPAPRERTLVPPATDRFDHVLRAEWTKFWSVRSTMWTFVCLVIVTIGISALFCLAVAVAFRNGDMNASDRAQFDPVAQSLSGVFLGQMAIIVLGTLTISSEYSTGGIRTTLTAVPQRLRLLGAKALVLAVIAFAAGLITMFPSFWLGQVVLATSDKNIEVSLGDPGVLRAVVGGALYVAACGLLGFALGALLRHTAGAITAAIGIVFVLPIVSNFLPGTWGDNVGKVLNAGGAIMNARRLENQLDPWTGYAVFSLWWIVLLTAAALLLRRRDA
jgi:ABC-2 type transport system permease protein